MKIVSLRIGKMKNNFRSLYPGFTINFHTLEDFDAMRQFRPFCFAGLNGSGKSNVLEALANIFYHLEICVARYLPDSMRNRENFKREISMPDAFELQYLIGNRDAKKFDLEQFHLVTIIKKENNEPKMFVKPYPFDSLSVEVEVPLTPDLATNNAAPGKSFLPDHVIGYSSGENEILSLPFIKSRLVHLDEFRQATMAGEQGFSEPENSLIYIDSNMSQAVLLACLLFEDNDTLKPLLDDIDGVGIEDLLSFRIHINLHSFKVRETSTNQDIEMPILTILEKDQLTRLKKCSFSWYSDDSVLILDFYNSPATKRAFRSNFSSSFELFQFFRLLYELNGHFIDDYTKEQVYRSKGFYTDGKLPEGSPNDDVFHFLDFKILKKVRETGEIKELLLREFSDGEHQFLHTMCICLLLKERRALLLLDEPETHFNPSWRARFINILNESITAGRNRKDDGEAFEINFLKDILMTSHSPFIISDCLPDNVIFFDKNKVSKKLEAKKASEMGINTYGSSVDYILKNVFKTKMISSQSFTELKNLITNGTLEELVKAVEYFGESSEKQFLFKRIYELTQEQNDS